MPQPNRSPFRRNTVLLTVALWVLCGGLSGCGSHPEDTSADDSRPETTLRPKQRFYDYRLIETAAGVRQWVLNSEQMLKFGGQEDVLLVAVVMDFFRDGGHFSVLTADSGLANLQTHNIEAWGDVVVVTDDGRRLETEQLFFNNEDQRIRNEVYNRFTRQTDILTGIGLEATPDLEYIEIKEQVTAEVADEPASGGDSP